MAIHSSHCSSESMSKRTPVGAQSCSGLLPNAYRKTSSACSLPGNPILFPGQHICHFHQLESLFMSPLITRCCDHGVGVAMCLMRPAPLRIAMAHPAVASSLIPRLGLSIPSPDPFAVTSTPCCCKTTPRSRVIETQPIPAAASLTAA